MITEAQRKLENVFGYDTFRPLQEEIIDDILNKKDALGIMPTGGGKSLCYQIPALIFDGLTIVVSPLISLMKDQVEQLQQFNIPALFLNSTLSDEAYAFNIRQLKKGKAKLLYLAPETLLMEKTRKLLDSLKVDLFTIDEAHCISEWGHDFRPDYRELTEVRKDFPDAACLALTATATPRVREDIARVLHMDESQTFLSSFDRKNLLLQVADKTDPLEQTLDFLYTRKKQSGIIYCFSRKQVDELYTNLKKEGYSVKPYHAGLSEGVRNRNQEMFIRDDVNIIVATIAFGMGINKPDVRYVIHYDMPKNIESYYQQIGRAGRDGLRADCLVLYSPSDSQKIRYFINRKEGREKEVAEKHLKALRAFLETDQCRRIPLMDYFGEEYPNEHCGMCDNCLHVDAEIEDLTVEAQKFLSGVARTGERFSEYHITDMLLGSETEEIKAQNHQELSTFGIADDWDREQWILLSRMLVSQNYLKKHDEGYLTLNDDAQTVLNGNEKVYGLLDRSSAVVDRDAAARTSNEVEEQHNEELFNLLRDKRKALADRNAVAPYAIFPDTTLMEMAYYYPQSRESLLKIYGVGGAKVKNFGKDFSRVIMEYAKEHELEEKTELLEDKSKSTYTGKLHERIGQAFNDGQSIEHLAEEKGVSKASIVRQLKKYMEDGNELHAEGIPKATDLSRRKQDKIMAAFDDKGSRMLRAVYDAMGKSIGYNELRVMQLYHQAKNRK